MGKGSSSNDKGIKLQEEALAESKKQNASMLALLQTQVNQAATLKLPKAQPAMPLPDLSGSDAVAQMQENQRNLQRRQGLGATRIAGQPPLRTAFGTPFLPAA